MTFGLCFQLDERRGSGQKNFFETRVIEYQNGGTLGWD
jgi:hypothetical protein